MSTLGDMLTKASTAPIQPQAQKLILFPISSDSQTGEPEGDDVYMYPKPSSAAKRTQKRSTLPPTPQTIASVSNRTVMKIRVKSTKVDARKCALCHNIGDGTLLSVCLW